MSSTKRIASRMAVAALAIAAFASTARSQQSDARAIRALSDQWQRDIAAQNVDAIVALHAPDAVVMMSHAPLATGSSHCSRKMVASLMVSCVEPTVRPGRVAGTA